MPFTFIDCPAVERMPRGKPRQELFSLPLAGES